MLSFFSRHQVIQDSFVILFHWKFTAVVSHRRD
jgi:hypothetical protein